jgi:hypothetical protein
MAEITQLDDINESDMLAALTDIPNIPVVPKEKNTQVEKQQDMVSSNNNNTVLSSEINKLDSGNILEMMQQLIDGKTIEISIKIKS